MIRWSKPILFGRVLKCFSKLKSLAMLGTTIPEPEELDGSIPFGGFGQQISQLILCSIGCATTTLMSLILSLPNLRELSLNDVETEGESSVPLEGSQSKTLRLLELHDVTANIVATLSRYGFTSRQISMGALAESLSVTQLLAPSSQILACLELNGACYVVGPSVRGVMLTDFQDSWSLRGDRSTRYPTIQMPQLPALETLVVETYTNDLSSRLTDVLFSIHSAPRLSSVTFTFSRLFGSTLPVYDAWRGVDGWLARLAGTGAKEKDGLKVEIRLLSQDWPAAEGFLCLFEKAGGEVQAIKTLETMFVEVP